MADYNEYNDQAQQGINTGRQAINSFDPTGVANSQKGGFNQVYGSQVGTIGDLTNTYAGQIAKNPQATDLYQQGNDIYNVSNLGRQAAYLNNQVTNAYPQALQQARGFDYSQGQVDNAVNQNLRFLQPQATAATSNYNQAADLASKYAAAGMQQNQMNLLPIQSQISSTNDAMTRMSTGYTVAAQNEMQGLINKLNSGIALSQAEIGRANQLSQMAEQYQQAQNANATALQQTKLQNQNFVLNPYQQFLNTATGKSYTYKGKYECF